MDIWVVVLKGGAYQPTLVTIFSITSGFVGIYFAEDNSNKIGGFDPATNTFTEWALPPRSGKLTSGNACRRNEALANFYIDA